MRLEDVYLTERRRLENECAWKAREEREINDNRREEENEFVHEGGSAIPQHVKEKRLEDRELNVDKCDTEDNEDVEMATTWAMLRSQEMPNQLIPNQPIPNNEVLADYDRREERINEGSFAVKTYPTPYEHDDVDPLSNVALFARAPCFLILSYSTKMDFLIGTQRTGSCLGTSRYLHCHCLVEDRTYHVVMVIWSFVKVDRYNNHVSRLHKQCWYHCRSTFGDPSKHRNGLKWTSFGIIKAVKWSWLKTWWM